MELKLKQISATVIPATASEPAKIVFVALDCLGRAYYKIDVAGAWTELEAPTET